MSDHFEGDDRRPGIKRKADENLEDLEGQTEPKKLKRDQDEFEQVPNPSTSENPSALANEIEDIQRELALLDAQLHETSAAVYGGGADSVVSSNGGGYGGGLGEFSEDMDSEIQVDDNSLGLSQSRSRRTPRPNRNFYGEFETDPEEQQRNSTLPTSGSAYAPPIITGPIRRPATPQKPKTVRPRGSAAAALGTSAAGGTGATAALATSGAAAPRAGRGGARAKGGKWRSPLVAPSWPKPRLHSNVPTKKGGNDPMSVCGRIIRDLLKHKHAWVFEKPVDVQGLRLTDYYQIIKRPMDLGTVKTKLGNGQYSNVTEFADDVRLTFRNAMTYNPPNNDVHVMAKALLQNFEDKIPKAFEVEGADPAMKKIHLEQNLAKMKGHEERLKQQLNHAVQNLERSKTTEILDVSPLLRPKSEIPATPMEYEEKTKLSQNINTLTLKYMKGLFKIFEEEKAEMLKSDAEIIDVEIDRLPNVLLRRLESYVSDCRNIDQQTRGSLGASLSAPVSALSPPSNHAHSGKLEGGPATPSALSASTPSTPSTTASSQGQGGKQPQTRPEGAEGEKKKDSDESSSSSSDSSSSETSEDSDSEDNNNNNNTKTKGTSTKSKHKNSSTTTTSPTLSSTLPLSTTLPSSSTTPSTTPTLVSPKKITISSSTINGVQVHAISPPSSTLSTTPSITPIPVSVPKPFILPTQKVEEKKVVVTNLDSWSGLVSGSGNSNGIPSSTKSTTSTTPSSAPASATSSSGIPNGTPHHIGKNGAGKSAAASDVESANPLSLLASLATTAPSLTPSSSSSPLKLSAPAIPILSPTKPPILITPSIPPSTASSSSSTSSTSASGDGALWDDIKKRAALNKQRERDRAELEAQIQKQQDEEKQKVEKEAAQKRKQEEVKRKQEIEAEEKKILEREKEVERLREAERAKRDNVGSSVNLTAQSDIMANLDRDVIDTKLDMTSLLGLKRRDDDD